MNRHRYALLGLLLLSQAAIFAQTTLPSNGLVQRIRLHGRSLENNLVGDSADRDVSVYLPPSYATSKARRYPVLYLLHGFGDSDDQWFTDPKHFISVPAVADRSIAAAGAKELIIVMPNAYTKLRGSMYSTSVTTGDWESFVVDELVPTSTSTTEP